MALSGIGICGPNLFVVTCGFLILDVRFANPGSFVDWKLPQVRKYCTIETQGGAKIDVYSTALSTGLTPRNSPIFSPHP